MGVTKTIAQVKGSGYDFLGLGKRVKEVLAACDTCLKGKSDRHKPYRLLQPLPVAERPWSSVTMDFITKLPLSKDSTAGWRVVRMRFVRGNSNRGAGWSLGCLR